MIFAHHVEGERMSSTHMMASLHETGNASLCLIWTGALQPSPVFSYQRSVTFVSEIRDDARVDVEVEAMEAGALVRYGRCFDGVRHAFKLSGGARGPVSQAPRSPRQIFDPPRQAHCPFRQRLGAERSTGAASERPTKTDVWHAVAITAGHQRIVGLSMDDLSHSLDTLRVHRQISYGVRSSLRNRVCWNG